jgi:hypothetical protein
MAPKPTYEDFLAKTRQVEKELDSRDNTTKTISERFIERTSGLIFGFGLFKIISSENNMPTDFTIIHLNEAFEKYSNVNTANVSGKKITEIVNMADVKFDWISVMGHIAIFGAKSLFQYYFEEKKIWFSVSSFCPEENYFVVAIDDMTDRKQIDIDFNRKRASTETMNNEQ